MHQSDIEKLADKVTEEKTRLRKSLLARKCHEKELREHRTLASEREIKLSAKEKQSIMREAFDLVLHDYPYDDRGALKSLIGTELNRRKKLRKDQSKEILRNAVAEHERMFGSVSDDELAEMKNSLRKEAECQLRIQELIECGKAVRDADGNLIIFNVRNEE